MSDQDIATMLADIKRDTQKIPLIESRLDLIDTRLSLILKALEKIEKWTPYNSDLHLEAPLA